MIISPLIFFKDKMLAQNNYKEESVVTKNSTYGFILRHQKCLKAQHLILLMLIQ